MHSHHSKRKFEHINFKQVENPKIKTNHKYIPSQQKQPTRSESDFFTSDSEIYSKKQKVAFISNCNKFTAIVLDIESEKYKLLIDYFDLIICKYNPANKYQKKFSGNKIPIEDYLGELCSKDELIIDTSALYTYIYKTVINKEIWEPDVFLYKSADVIYGINHNDDF